MMNPYDIQIPALDAGMMEAAQARQLALAKPPRSLGVLEEISVRFAGMTGRLYNEAKRRRILIFAADNGVVAEGVTSAPQSVTLAQTINFTRGLTGVAVLAKHYHTELRVYDMGINAQFHQSGVIDCKIAMGTRNLAVEPAMTREQALRAMETGFAAAEQAKREGVEILGIGEMGIGNTTTSSAVLAALTGADVEAVTGRGGGLTDEGFLRKKEVLRQSLALHRPDKNDVIGVLAGVGGLDLAAMTGAFLGCAHERVPAAVDGFISIAAALCAVRLCPAVRDYLFLSHDSYEVGYRIAAEELGLTPCLHLGMRLGEGSGCPLLFRVLEGACGVMRGMATFDEASIEDGYLDEIRAMDAFTVEAT